MRSNVAKGTTLSARGKTAVSQSGIGCEASCGMPSDSGGIGLMLGVAVGANDSESNWGYQGYCLGITFVGIISVGTTSAISVVEHLEIPSPRSTMLRREAKLTRISKSLFIVEPPRFVCAFGLSHLHRAA